MWDYGFGDIGDIGKKFALWHVRRTFSIEKIFVFRYDTALNDPLETFQPSSE